MKIDTTTKLVNGISFDQAMAEGKYFQLVLQLVLNWLCSIVYLFVMI